MLMHSQRQPGYSDEERAVIEARIREEYPDEEVVIIYEDDAAYARHLPATAEQIADDYREPTFLQKLVVVTITLIAGVYLVYPSLGIFELIPDAIPLIGSLDEFTATAIVVSGLHYFGINVNWLASVFGPGRSKRKRRE